MAALLLAEAARQRTDSAGDALGEGRGLHRAAREKTAAGGPVQEGLSKRMVVLLQRTTARGQWAAKLR